MPGDAIGVDVALQRAIDDRRARRIERAGIGLGRQAPAPTAMPTPATMARASCDRIRRGLCHRAGV